MWMPKVCAKREPNNLRNHEPSQLETAAEKVRPYPASLLLVLGSKASCKIKS